ncbi:MAG: glycosyl transferase [Bacteroidetes bacterium]|nr:glycosyl transferase [Bacteroidota bacterium]
MKIFYAVQATGNGHISRAMSLLPYLQQYGEVDIFLSGNNSHLQLDAPVKYRSKGVSLFYNNCGGLDYWKIAKGLNLFRIQREIRELPVEEYDVIINDFDFITSAACARKKIPSIHFGHQASFQSKKTPRPESTDFAGEWILKNFVKASHHVGLHFKRYDLNIFTPVIKKEILEADPADHGYITVYLPSCSDLHIYKLLSPLSGFRFRVFSKDSHSPYSVDNISYLPVTKELFNDALIHCSGIITGAGFETPAEALYLGKRVLVTPIRGQYEQCCNAAALQQLGVSVFSQSDNHFSELFLQWIHSPVPDRSGNANNIQDCLEYLFSLTEKNWDWVPA